MNERRKTFFVSSFAYFQNIIKKSGPAASASYTLIGSVIIFGILGYFLDGWFNTAPWLLLTGFLIGLILGFYELAKTIWR